MGLAVTGGDVVFAGSGYYSVGASLEYELPAPSSLGIIPIYELMAPFVWPEQDKGHFGGSEADAQE